MNPDDPRHGEYRGWAQHDRDGEDPCAPCLEARRAYGRVRPHLTALGIAAKVPVGERAHQTASALSDLTEREWSDHTGMSAVTRRRVLTHGPETVVRTDTRRRLEAIDANQVRAALLTNIGCVRRLRALAHLGYSATAVAAMAGIHPQTARMIQGDRLRYIEYGTRARIAAVFTQLEHARLPVTHITARAFNLARRSGWAPPAAWDRIDDPRERPKRGSARGRSRTEVDPIVVERLLAGDRIPNATPAEKDEAMRRWKSWGRSAGSLAAMHGWAKPERDRKAVA